VNPFASVALLVSIATVIFLLPLLPIVVELERKCDVQPLRVIQEHAGEASYFGDGFRAYINSIRPVLNECLEKGVAAKGTMPDGVPYLVFGRGEGALALGLSRAGNSCEMVLASSTNLLLPPDTIFSQDIYSNACVIGGSHNTYRAVLGEQEVHLGSGSRVMRWVQAGTEFTADRGCQLFTRVSAGRLIRLDYDCRFVRLHAPRIEIGSAPNLAEIRDFRSEPHHARLLHDGNFRIAAGEVFRGDLVVRGQLEIGDGARVYGSLKCERDMVLGRSVQVSGSLVSEGRLQIGANSLLAGPVIAERGLVAASGTSCGTPKSPTTVSAPEMAIETGVVVFGTIWARQQGKVLAVS
jgi:hypothetical protein